jgi:RNA polymerase sigma-70 factor (ECF subfamily)
LHYAGTFDEKFKNIFYFTYRLRTYAVFIYVRTCASSQKHFKGVGYVQMIDLIKASQGDKEALENIVVAYDEKAKKIASIYLGDDFEDIVQDVWVKIIEKCYLLSNVKNFDNWLFLVVRNFCFNYLKVEKKRRKNYEMQLYENLNYIDNHICTPDILEKYIDDESSDLLRSIIEGLGELYSLPIVMRYTKQMSMDEISQALNLPLSTVKWRLHAGKMKIKNELLKRGLK